jgi:hypothetical protein
VYAVTALSPLSAGGIQLTVALSMPAVAVTFVGGVGIVGALGVTGTDGADGLLGPLALSAVTVKVYEVPLTSGLTSVLNVDPPTWTTTPPGDEVTV